VGVLLKKKLFFIFEHFSQKKRKKNTRTSMVAAVTSSPRVRFFIFHDESGLFLKIISKSIRLVRLFPHFFIFHFRALLTEEMEKEHAHIVGGGCNKLATCLLSSSFCLENVQFYYFYSKLRLHARTTHVLSFLHVQRPGPLLAVHTPPKPCSRRAGTPCSSLLPLTHSILHLLFPLMCRVAPRLSFGPRSTATPPS